MGLMKELNDLNGIYQKMYEGKKAKKDYDGDGKVESGSKEHAGVVHNAIQKKKGGKADGQDTRSEAMVVTNADKKANTPAYQNYKKGMKNKKGEPVYKAADHLKDDVEFKPSEEVKKLVESGKFTKEEIWKIVEGEEETVKKSQTLDELKKSTLGSYVAKGSKDLANRRFDQGDSEKRKYDPDEADDKEDKKLDKREQGIARAAKKLSKEGYQRDPERQEKDRKSSKQTDPSKAGFTGIGDSIEDIMKQNAAMKAAAKKKTKKEGYQRNPEKGEAEERKAEKDRKASGRMPPRGDKRREDFERWYAANVR